MYEDFYRFKEKPFSLTPDPKFLYLSKQHQGALDHMLYGIRQREGFMVIMGDVGTGKTTLCRCLLDRLDKKIEVALILNPLLSDMDLLRTCVHDLRVQPLFYQQDKTETVEPSPAQAENAPNRPKPNALGAETRLRVSGGPRPIQIKLGSAPVAETVPDTQTVPAGTVSAVENPAKPDEKYLQWIYKASKKELIDALNAFLLQQYEKGGSTVLIIDEAQNLSLEVMEQLRILSNLETEKEKLLQIIFVGQLELGAKLRLDELKQLNQRISIRYEITPLSKEEMIHYIEHRLLVAGSASRISFGRASFNEIYNYSRGYPRLINLVCDRTLLAGYNAKADELGLPHVKQAVQSLQGEEEKSDLDKHYDRSKALFAASTLFFVSGMAFFFFSGNAFFHAVRPEPQKIPLKEPTRVEAPPPVAPAAPSATAPSPVAEEKPVVPQIKEETVAVAVPQAEKASPATIATANPPTPATADTVEKNAAVPEVPTEEKNLAAEKTSDPSPAPTSSQKMEKESYRIQITSVSTDIQATDEVKQLKKDGYKAYWKKADSAGQVWYVVYVGPFENLNTAKIHLSALKQSGHKPILFSVSKSE